MAEQAVLHSASETSSTATPLSSAWVAWGQWLAIATMSADHIAAYLYPDAALSVWVSSSVGRIAFPLFASMMAWHVVHHTRSLRRYVWRVLALGCISQVFYMSFAAYPVYAYLNVCFTLALGLMLCGCVEFHKHARTLSAGPRRLLAFCQLAALLLGILGASMFVEFGLIGVFVIPTLVTFFRESSERPGIPVKVLAASILLGGLLNASLINMDAPLVGQWPAIFGAGITVTTVIVILLAAGGVRSSPSIEIPRWLWRAWYPAHFALMRLLT